MDEQAEKSFEALRAREFPQLSDNSVYADNAGSALPCKSYIEALSNDLLQNVRLNPHSSAEAEKSIDAVRKKVSSRVFNVREGRGYGMIWTRNATDAIKTAGETFPFSELVYLDECHTSIVGLRNLAQKATCYGYEEFLHFAENSSKAEKKKKNTLVAFPAMSNFCGKKFPLSLIDKLQSNPNYFVLLDAAAFVATNDLDLSEIRPAFVCVSFYKMFGYPSNLGALIVRDDILTQMSKRYFGGGTVKMHLVNSGFTALKDGVHGFEDGTAPFHEIRSIEIALETRRKIFPDSSLRTFRLAQYLYGLLIRLEHYNGAKVVVVYSDNDFGDESAQGSIVNFNLLDSSGLHFGFNAFRRLAEEEGIIVRTGCFCNVGACQKYLGFDDQQSEFNYKQGHVCGDDVDLIAGNPVGSVRVSFGVHSLKKDVDKIVSVIRDNFVQTEADLPAVVERNPVGVVSGISLYPVKSCGPQEVDEWPMSAEGLKYDRQWAVIKDGKCLTQKDLPSLCLISPRVDMKENVLTLRYPAMESVSIDITAGNERERGTFCAGKVCGEGIIGVDCGSEVNKWLADVFGDPLLRLIRFSSSETERKRSNLSNVSPYLILNQSSVEDFHRRLDDDRLSVKKVLRQFRANLIITGPKAYTEDKWKVVNVECTNLERTGNCMRCKMVSIDQENGTELKGVSRALALMTERRYSFGSLFQCSNNNNDGTNDQTIVRIGSKTAIKLY